MGFARSERGVNLTFVSNMTFNNGVTLPAGTYRMQVPENSRTPEVEFYKEHPITQDWDRNPSATVEAKVVAQQHKNSRTEIDSVQRGDAQLIRVIRPKGWEESLHFASTN